jgi:hypothetical protein
MSPLDMLIFFFFILVTIKAVSVSIDYWKDADEEASLSQTNKIRRRTAVSGAAGSVINPSARITPIKRADANISASAVSSKSQRHYHLNDKGAA